MNQYPESISIVSINIENNKPVLFYQLTLPALLSLSGGSAFLAGLRMS
jgi:hypothetical protein